MRLLALYLFLFIFVNSGFAEEKKYQLDQFTYDGIMNTQTLLDANKSKEAEKALLALELSTKVKRKLDKAYVQFYLGYFYSLQNTSKKAIKHFKNALSYGTLPPDQVSSAYINLVQLMMEKEEDAQSLLYLDKLIAMTAPPKSEYYIYKANIYFSQKRYAQTIAMIDKAISIDKVAKINWLKMQFYCYYIEKKYVNSIKINKKLIAMDPHNKEYWLQLSSLYSVTQDNAKSLASLEISEIAKLDLMQNECLRLINLFSYNGMPYKAATLMQSQMESGKIELTEKYFDMLGNLYYEAKDFTQALNYYKKAANINKNTKIYYKIAQVAMSHHEYETVITYTKSALKNSKEKIAQKQLLLGKAYYALNKNNEAISVFKEALKYKFSKKIAQAWLDYIK